VSLSEQDGWVIVTAVKSAGEAPTFRFLRSAPKSWLYFFDHALTDAEVERFASNPEEEPDG
jgi:hypothetical protein